MDETSYVMFDHGLYCAIYGEKEHDKEVVALAIHIDITDSARAVVYDQTRWTGYGLKQMDRDAMRGLKDKLDHDIKTRSLIPVDQLPGEIRVEFRSFRIDEKQRDRIEAELRVLTHAYEDIELVRKGQLMRWSIRQMARRTFYEGFWKERWE